MMKRQITTIKDFLLAFGVKTREELYQFLDSKRKNIGESRYVTMSREFGQVNADRVIRRLEVQSW